MKSIGIDIGTSSIKVVEVQSTNRGLQILSFTEHPLGQNPAHDTEIEVLEFLQGLALQADPQTKVVMALGQEKVSVRLKYFPFADRLKILKSLPFELEEDLPFSSDTAIFEARVIRSRGPQAEVLTCATPKHRIGEFLAKYQSTGLSLNILSAEGLAFANCFERWWDPVPQSPGSPLGLDQESQPARNLRLIIQMGHSHTLVTAFENDRMVAVRSILWGGKHVSEAIARKYEIPYIEALREMRTKAFILPSRESASYDQIVFSDTIASQFRELGRELKLSILEIETELNGKVVSAETTGGLSGIAHVPAFLTQLLEVPVNPLSFLDGYVTNFEKTPAIENSIGTALGLAFEGLRKPRNPALQFLRGEFALQNESLQVFFDTWGTTLKIASAAFVLFFAYTMIRSSLSDSLLSEADEALRNQAKTVAKLPTRQANEVGIKKYIRDKRKRAQDMKSLEGLSRMNSALDLLKKISDASPARTTNPLIVTLVRIEDQNVFVEGVAGTRQDSQAFERSLKSLARDGRVVQSAAPPTPGKPGLPFALGFSVDRGVEK